MDEKDLLEDYVAQLEAVEHFENELKNAKDVLNKCKKNIIEYLMDRGQNRTGSYEGVGSLTLKSFNTYKVEESDQERLFQFLQDNNLGEVVKKSIHHKTLDRICNELVEDGQPLPEYINTFNITTVQLNKG